MKDANDALQAPVKAGQTVGTAQLTGDNVASLAGNYIDVALAAQSSVAKANIFVRAARKVASFFTAGVLMSGHGIQWSMTALNRLVNG